MKSKNNLFTAIAAVSLLILVLFLVFTLTNRDYSRKGSEELSYDSALTSKQFIEKLLTEQGIDKKYFDRNICFSIIEDDGSETVSCFIPNKFDEYLKNVGDPDEYKRKLSKSKVLNTVQEVSFEKKEPFLQFVDFIAPDIDKISDKYIKTRLVLESMLKSNTGGLNEHLNYYYLLSLEGNFKDKSSLEKTICKKFKKLCDDDKVSVTIKGKVFDQNGKPVNGAKLRILGDDSVITKTNENGEYVFSSKVFPFSKYRLQASKVGMSIGTYNFIVPNDGIKDWSFSHDFTLVQALKTVVIDTKNNTISGEGTSKDDKGFIVKTEWSEYKIPFNSLVKKDGTPFKGKVNAYLFEFNRSTPLDDLLNNDIFDNVAGYAGDLMKTFGMPFILFVADDGEEVHVLKSNPMILRNKIQEMQALLTGSDKIYGPLTVKDLEFLVKKSNELGGYPIDRNFLIKNDILRFPAWWIYDQSKGIWVNHPIKLLNTDGTIETTFYTISGELK